MSSTDLEAPPLRLILIAIILVVGLHLLTAIALVIIKAPMLKDKPIKETPPLEIQMVTLPTQPIENVVTEVEEVPQSKAESIPTPKPEPKPEPKTQQKMKAVTPVDPVVREEEPIVQKEKPVQTPPIKEPPVKKKIEDKPPVIDKSVADEQRRIIAAQAEKAAQQAERQAQAKALQEAQAQAARDAQAQADANAAKEAAQKAAQAKAEREAEAAARAKAEAAASNEPVNFTASAANWASAPNFSFPDRAARRARSGDTLNVVLVLRVNKQGGIDSIRVAQSSGNPLLDKEAQRQVRSGKFKPFTKNGAPVVGNVTLPIAYAVP
ncbi:energy transducer TonB [Psychrobacter communis]|uniref:Energy transducer TonB n=1 Tax=Psychrobacter communis TaxID=2762238 RepID=A0ABR8RH95_9GAMM|nr:energy transducer TonB [Psychrobacter communis]MBD7947084.1 energy transducer TonB [Psychrobacter communis]